MKLNVKVSNVVQVETKIDGKELSLKLTENGNYSVYSALRADMIVLSARELDAVVNTLYPNIQRILEDGHEDSAKRT